MVANTPQVAFSLFYFTYNGLFTLFLLAAEWDGFEGHRKGLRVSNRPRGSQRIRFPLQIPVRWALPLMALSATMHWLCSQSFFLVSFRFDHSRLGFPGPDGRLDCGTRGSEETRYHHGSKVCGETFFTAGFSPQGILACTSVFTFMVFFVVLVGLRRFKNGGIPLVGSCSAAISACCHPVGEGAAPGESETVIAIVGPAKGGADGGQRHGSPEGSSYTTASVVPLTEASEMGLDAALLPVQWGVMGVGEEARERGAHESLGVHSGAVQHCGFSGRRVSEPRDGGLYAGTYRG